MSITGPQQTPPGWYPQADGSQRYWDGRGWTEHTQPPPASPAGFPQPPTRGQLPQRKRGAGRVVLLSVVGVVGVILVISVIGAALNGGGQAGTAVGSDAASSGSGAETGATSKAPAKASTKKPAPAGPGIGDKVRDGKFSFVVTKISQGKTKVGDDFLNKKAQGEFVFVYLDVENIGDESQLFDGSSQILYDAKGRKFSSDAEAAIYVDNSESFLNEINPGNKVKGIVVFDVPKGAKGTKIELHDSPFSGGVDVTLR